jgi:hypothetical protein
LIFYFAGHGTEVYVPPNSGSVDASRHALCLADGLLMLTEIWRLVNALPQGCSLVCILDAPYGRHCLDVPLTYPRDAESFAAILDDKRQPAPGVRYLRPRAPTKDGGPRVPTTSGLPAGVNGFVLAACGAREVAYEVGGRSGRSRGVFTLALCEAIASFEGRPCTVLHVYDALCTAMRRRVSELKSKELAFNDATQGPILAYGAHCPPELTTFILPLAAYQQPPNPMLSPEVRPPDGSLNASEHWQLRIQRAIERGEELSQEELYGQLYKMVQMAETLKADVAKLPPEPARPLIGPLNPGLGTPPLGTPRAAQLRASSPMPALMQPTTPTAAVRTPSPMPLGPQYVANAAHLIDTIVASKR